jgi:hypothetical protein
MYRPLFVADTINAKPMLSLHLSKLLGYCRLFASQQQLRSRDRLSKFITIVAKLSIDLCRPDISAIMVGSVLRMAIVLSGLECKGFLIRS